MMTPKKKRVMKMIILEMRIEIETLQHDLDDLVAEEHDATKQDHHKIQKTIPEDEIHLYLHKRRYK